MLVLFENSIWFDQDSIFFISFLPFIELQQHLEKFAKKLHSAQNGWSNFRYSELYLMLNPIAPIDIGELDGGKVASVTFPKPNDLTNFNVSITPDTGYWKDATYKFVFAVPPHYPHSPPKVECKTNIYHPNIDLQGKVCLNILREDWRPVLDINAVIYGLIYLFYEPNPDDPLNHEAADLFRKDIKSFERLVNRTLRGGKLDGVTFERLI
jgi:ubiquitin-conjugating enzyme E2 M